MRIIYLIVSISFFSNALFGQLFNGLGGDIPDDGPPVEFYIEVSGLNSSTIDESFGLLSVCFDITHTYLADLHISLIAPDGTSVGIVSAIGGGDDNFTSTCFDQNASTPIGSGSAPYTGSYIPIDNLGEVNNGQIGNGTWTLRIHDNWAQDAGNLNVWTLSFGDSAAGPITVSESYLPIVIIDTQGEEIPDEPKITGTMKIIHNNDGELNYVTDIANEYDGPIGIELRGAYSQSLPQKPYGIETRNEVGENSNVSILGMPSENDWVLLANYNDKAFVRNTLAFKLFSEMGNYAPRMHFCEVIINGSYRGIYLFGEKIKRDNGRVDIAKLDIDENTGDDLTGGYIFKTDYWNWDDSWESDYHPIDHPEYDIRFVQYYPKPANITSTQEQYLEAYVDSFETALYSDEFSDPLLGYRNFMDVNSFIDYFLVNELSRNNDGFKKSRYYHKDKNSNGGKIKAGPVWDFDWAWKNINSCLFANTDGSGWAHHINDCNPDVNSPGWYLRLLEDVEFENDLKCRYEYHRQNSMDSTYILNYIDSIAFYLDDAQQRHYSKWPTLGAATGAPEVDPPAESFDEEIERLKDWITLRINWLDSNMPGECILVDDIHEERNLSFSIYPNPANNVLRIESYNYSIVSLYLIDLQGRIIKKMDINEPSLELDLSNFSNGMYLIRLMDEEGFSETKPFIVKHL